MPNVRKQKEHYSYLDEWKRLWEPDWEAIGCNNGQTCDPTRVDPKVLQWAKDHCAHTPHFVKVINPHAAHGRPGLVSSNTSAMSVPEKFVKQHFRELERVITLEQGDGRKWRVAFGAAQNYPVWSQGWDRFAKDNNLKPGDVAVFVLVRNSCFRFALFDADGNIVSEKSTATTTTLKNDNTVLLYKREFPSCSPQSHQDPETKKRLFMDNLSTERFPEYKVEPNPLLPVPAKERTAKLQKIGEEVGAPRQTLILATEDGTLSPNAITIAMPPSTKDWNSLQISSVPTSLHGESPQFESLNPLAFTFKSRRRTITPLERQSARELAMAHAALIVPGQHHFVSVMSETHVYRDFHLVLPNGFATALRLPASPTRLRFLDDAGHAWDVYSKRNALSQFALHRRYWALFALHHRLEEGDVCVFALKESKSKEEATVRIVVVHIFRVVPISMTDISSVHAHYETHRIDSNP